MQEAGRSTGKLRYLAAISAFAFLAGMGASKLRAEQAPSNAQLYKMILELKAQNQKLQRENKRLSRRLSAGTLSKPQKRHSAPPKGFVSTSTTSFATPNEPRDETNWAGLYVGGFMGWGWGTSQLEDPANNNAPIALFTFDRGAEVDGVIGGGQLGYDFSIDNLVLGIVADASVSTIEGINGRFSVSGINFENLTVDLDWLATLRGRLGWNVDPVLFYAHGGLALAQLSATAPVAPGAQNQNFFQNTLSLRDSSFAIGWTVGAGIEMKFTDNISLFSEYSYVNLDSTINWSVVGDTAIGRVNGRDLDADLDLHMIKAGFNIRLP